MEELIQRAASDLVNSQYGIALTGAGISTESGIPDFRGPAGVWTLNPDAEKRAYQGYQEFIDDPEGWWKNTITSSAMHSLGNLEQVRPNLGHQAIAELEKMGILKCTITQNIDALHEKAGTVKVLEYHGSVIKLRCLSCGARFKKDEFDLEQLLQENRLPPSCPECRGILKSDTVFFGEAIPGDVAEQSLEEVWKCDLMLVCGTSAVVFPFASLPRIVRERGAATIIEINAEATPLTEEGVSDYLLQGKTGEILPLILEEVKRLKGQRACLPSSTNNKHSRGQNVTKPTTEISIRCTRLSIVGGDITDQNTDAIVNAANSSLMGGGGVDGAIHLAGGPAILEECKQIVAKRGQLPTGQAVISGGGKLKARFVIHTVGPVWQGGNEGEPELLASAYRESLRVAAENDLSSVAFPSISTGDYSYPMDGAAAVATETVTTFLKEHSTSIKEVVFVLFHSSAFDSYSLALGEYCENIDD